MKIPLLLRGAVLLLLGLALALSGVWRTRTGPAAPAWIDDARALDRAADSLLVGRAPPAIARASTAPPTAAELETLAAAARRAPLYAAIPARNALVEAQAPARALSGRAAAVGFRVTATPGDSVWVRLTDETGVLDSLRVRTDAGGHYAGAFRVRPPRPGWREWTVTAGDATARTGAWVDSAGAPHVIVRAGFPHWESKFVVRALEESGATVETAYDLGRGQLVAAGGGAISAERLNRADAVILLHGAPVGDGERRMLLDWSAARGGGVLLVGGQAAAGASAFALTAGPTRARAVDGPTLTWTLPPELSALPGDRVRSGAVLTGSPRAGAAMAASTPEGGVLALRPLGRGRAASLGLTETWRWRMEAGRVREHREFWRALVDWLASAPRDPVTLMVPEPVGPAGARRDVVVYTEGDEGATLPPLLLTRPGRGTDTVALAPDPSRAGVMRGAFLPADTGLYTFAFAGGAPSAAYRATAAAGPAEDAWQRLSMIAGASGGGMLPADSLRPLMRRLTPEGADTGTRLPLGWLLFFGVLLLAGAEWAIRRLRGDA
ncbi:hypothetical protein [Longimicrobium sp.]|uniref:hypothetical protein n=1 Tax=Longimicrobium sp. TaxID=2029185 RepID=UPI002E36F9C7|nr:hypothetical protein [Longimicrobium sp.]HEX6038029.1 hypothetical protein [Longimicrobium sp.]